VLAGGFRELIVSEDHVVVGGRRRAIVPEPVGHGEGAPGAHLLRCHLDRHEDGPELGIGLGSQWASGGTQDGWEE